LILPLRGDGDTVGLAFVSPKTGARRDRGCAGVWTSRLLPLPAFVVSGDEATAADWRDGLRLTDTSSRATRSGLQHRAAAAGAPELYDRVAGTGRRIGATGLPMT